MKGVEQEVRLELQLQRMELRARQLRLEVRRRQFLPAQSAPRIDGLEQRHQRRIHQQAPDATTAQEPHETRCPSRSRAWRAGTPCRATHTVNVVCASTSSTANAGMNEEVPEARTERRAESAASVAKIGHAAMPQNTHDGTVLASVGHSSTGRFSMRCNDAAPAADSIPTSRDAPTTGSHGNFSSECVSMGTVKCTLADRAPRRRYFTPCPTTRICPPAHVTSTLSSRPVSWAR